jgi:hypothetical protein
MYSILLTDAIIRFRRHLNINILVEDNETLRPLIPQIVQRAFRRAQAKSTLPVEARVDVKMVPKNQPMTLGVIDFYMRATARWVGVGAPRNGENADYRNFAALESAISLLTSLEHGVLSSRKARIAT